MFKFAAAVRTMSENSEKNTQIHIHCVFQIVAFGVFAYCNGTPHQKRSSLFDLGPWDRVSTQTHLPVVSTSTLGNNKIYNIFSTKIIFAVFFY